MSASAQAIAEQKRSKKFALRLIQSKRRITRLTTDGGKRLRT
jgi:hypothetical protein